MPKPDKFIEYEKGKKDGKTAAADHFDYCSVNNFPLVEVTVKSNKVVVHWVYLTMRSEQDKPLHNPEVKKQVVKKLSDFSNCLVRPSHGLI